jgi:hypothetical protein
VPIYITDMAPLDAVTVDPASATIAADGSLQFTCSITYTDLGGPYPEGETIEKTYEIPWISSDGDVAYVKSFSVPGGGGGHVYARSAGTISIGAFISALLSTPPTDPPPSPDDPGPSTDPDDPTDWCTFWADLEVTPAPPPPPDPEGRFLLAFDDPATEPYPEWTRLDDVYPNLITSYTIDRGRQDELQRTDTGRATVAIADVDGVLDPTNVDGPYWNKIKPGMQACLGRLNPVTDEWKQRFRGFVDELVYQVDPSQKVNRLVISLVDQFDRLGRAELQPGQAGSFPPAGSEGQVYYPSQRVEDRIVQALSDYGLPGPFRAILPGGVTLWGQVYSAGESPLAVCQEAADGDFPNVSNLLCDRRGRVAFRSRRARFFPDDVAADSGGLWEYNTWKVGDGAAVNASPTDTAQIRSFGFSRSIPKVINSAVATQAGEQDELIGGLLVANAESIAQNGVCSWSATNLLTYSTNSALEGPFPEPDGRAECQRFAIYYLENYKFPDHDRVQEIAFRSMRPDDARAAANWELLNGVDIGDLVTLTLTLPGGGGWDSVDYFVEGVHEEVQPLQPGYDDVTLRLDLSPRALYATDPWA